MSRFTPADTARLNALCHIEPGAPGWLQEVEALSMELCGEAESMILPRLLIEAAIVDVLSCELVPSEGRTFRAVRSRLARPATKVAELIRIYLDDTERADGALARTAGPLEGLVSGAIADFAWVLVLDGRTFRAVRGRLARPATEVAELIQIHLEDIERADEALARTAGPLEGLVSGAIADFALVLARAERVTRWVDELPPVALPGDDAPASDISSVTTAIS